MKCSRHSACHCRSTVSYANPVRFGLLDQVAALLQLVGDQAAICRSSQKISSSMSFNAMLSLNHRHIRNAGRHHLKRRGIRQEVPLPMCRLDLSWWRRELINNVRMRHEQRDCPHR